jgi:tellurite resistance protein TehA-like permease
MRIRFEHGRRDELQTLHPAYFAMVMATGIVSIAAHLHGVPVLPTMLVWLNALFLAALVAATVTRILRYPHAFAGAAETGRRILISNATENRG